MTLLRPFVVAVALVAVCSAVKNVTQWVTPLPNTPTLFTSSSVVTGDIYAVTSLSSVIALNTSTGAVLWQYSRTGYITLGTATIAARGGAAVTQIAYPNINGSDCYVDSIDGATGTLLWRSSPALPMFSSVHLGPNVAVVKAFPVGNASTQNVTAFNTSDGKRVWSLPEWSVITTQSGILYNNVFVVVTLHMLPIPPTIFAVRAFDATNGAPLWTFPCTNYLAESVDSKVGNRDGAAWGALIAVFNQTSAAKGGANSTSSIVFLSRWFGLRVGVVELPRSQMAMFGTFTNGESRFVYTDGLTVVSCIDVATKAYLWNTSLWTDPAFRPFADLVTQVTQAGDQVLLTFAPVTNIANNVSIPTPVNMTAFDLKTGARQGSVAFPTNNQVLLPLLDRRLLVQSYNAPGFSVYSLVTGALLATYTEWTIIVGTVQVVSPGVIIAIDEQGNVRRLEL